jgi:hypothetical protein
MPRTLTQTKNLIAFIVLLLISMGSASQAQPIDFRFALKSVLEADSEKYVVEKVNIRKFNERFKPFVSYWGVRENEIPAIMTFRFPLEKPLKSARLYVPMISTNFNNDKNLGKGMGSGSVWCSRNGKDWVLLKKAEIPIDKTVQEVNFNGKLPKEMVGAKELWLQFRLNATGMKDSTYSTAQFARTPADDPNSFVFNLLVSYIDSEQNNAKP